MHHNCTIYHHDTTMERITSHLNALKFAIHGIATNFNDPLAYIA